MKFKLDKDQVIVVFLGAILLVSLIETYIRLSREGREMDKELKKLDIEINTLQLRYENEKRLSEQVHRLSEALPSHDDNLPADTEPQPQEELKDKNKPLDWDAISAVLDILDDKTKSLEEKIELCSQYRGWVPVFEGDIIPIAFLPISELGEAKLKQPEMIRYDGDREERPAEMKANEERTGILIGYGYYGNPALASNAPPADTEPELDEEPEEKRLTIREWEEELGFEVLDPDGFDRTNEHLYEHGFTRAEFLCGARGSTVRDIENLHNAIMGIVPEPTEAAPAPESDHIPHKEKMVEEVATEEVDDGYAIVNGFGLVCLVEEAAAKSDHISHEEKMVEEVTTTEEVDDGVIRAPFDGEIIEMRTGCFTIKAAGKGMKITFDFDFCQVVLHEVVKKGQILGRKA